MSEFVSIAAVDEIPEGSARSYEIGGKVVAIYHTSGGFFSTDNTCPHRGGPLAEGDLQGTEITCPWHFWTFDLRTGSHADPRIRLATHEVRVAEGRIWIRLSTEAGMARGTS